MTARFRVHLRFGPRATQPGQVGCTGITHWAIGSGIDVQCDGYIAGMRVFRPGRIGMGVPSCRRRRKLS